jgi:hypothetical protein
MDEQDDPVLQMVGVGKEIWSGTTADEYVRDLRANWFGDEANADDSEKTKGY